MEGHSNSTKFIHLPNDILTESLMFLDAQSLLKCKQICSSIRTLIDTEIRLQYMIELYANNMVHNSRLERPEPLYLRLKHLAEHQGRHLRYPLLVLQKIDSFAQTTAFPPNEDGKETCGGIAAQGILVVWRKFGSLVRFTQIPSRNLGIQSSQYDLRLVDACIVHLTFDPAQDLVVVLETTTANDLTCPLVSVRSLLTGGKHPMAAKLVCWLGDSDIPLDKLLITVYGDYVALTIRHLEDRVAKIIVFNWKTSEIIQNIHRECILHGYEWLTERYLLLAETHSNPTTLALTIVDVLNPDHPVICTLNLPRMLENALAFDTCVRIRTHPSSQGILSQRDVPFFPNPEYKLILVLFYTRFVCDFVVATLASDLLKIARENERKDSISMFTWDDWGPTHTRVIQPTGTGWFHISAYGTRALVQDAYRLALYDFNQKLIRRDLAKQVTDPEGQVVIEPTVIQNERVFMNEVKTCLPYRIMPIARPSQIYPGRTCELSTDSLVCVHKFGTGNDNVDIYSF